MATSSSGNDTQAPAATAPAKAPARKKAVAAPAPAKKAVKAVKAATKPAAPSAKKTTKPPAKKVAAAPGKAPAASATDKPAKAKKPKLVRDSFTIPKTEYSVLDDLKQRAAKLGQPAKKSELLRAGIKALAAMSDAALQAALASVPAIKTGRPSQSA
ncbi:MAG TPA: hypothetical protein VGE70_08760 [Burkholderiaceae bacterium]